MNSAKEYFGTDFVEKVYQIFERAEQEDKFVFIHGAYSLDDAMNIVVDGLRCDYPELLYTAELMSISDKLLFDKLKSWPHWELKYLLTLCVPKNSGKGGIPIWNEDSTGQYYLPPQLINGIIDVNKKLIIPNPKYNPLKNIEATIEDRSFETRSGKFIEISLPPDELEFYGEEFEYEERD